jgi:hypothetical protein
MEFVLLAILTQLEANIKNKTIFIETSTTVLRIVRKKRNTVLWEKITVLFIESNILYGDHNLYIYIYKFIYQRQFVSASYKLDVLT